MSSHFFPDVVFPSSASLNQFKGDFETFSPRKRRRLNPVPAAAGVPLHRGLVCSRDFGFRGHRQTLGAAAGLFWEHFSMLYSVLQVAASRVGVGGRKGENCRISRIFWTGCTECPGNGASLGWVELALPKIPHSKSPITGFWTVPNTLGSFRGSHEPCGWQARVTFGCVGATGAAGACEQPGVLAVAVWCWWRLPCPSTTLGTHWELDRPPGPSGGVAAPKAPGAGTPKVPCPAGRSRMWERGSGGQQGLGGQRGRAGSRSRGSPGGPEGSGPGPRAAPPGKPPRHRGATCNAPPRPLRRDRAHRWPYMANVGVTKAVPRWHWRGGARRGRGRGAGSRLKAAPGGVGAAAGSGFRYRPGDTGRTLGTPGLAKPGPAQPPP